MKFFTLMVAAYLVVLASFGMSFADLSRFKPEAATTIRILGALPAIVFFLWVLIA